MWKGNLQTTDNTTIGKERGNSYKTKIKISPDERHT